MLNVGPSPLRSREARLLGHVRNPECYREILIESAGALVALSVWEPEPAADAQGTLVFLPGTAVHPLFYEEFLDGLCTAGWAVVGVHPEGHGKSPRARRTLRLEHLVRNAHDAVAWSRRHLPGPLVLMGSSQGSLVALLAAAGDPTSSAAGGAVGVIAHNVFDPGGVDGVRITRFGRLARLHPAIRGALVLAARLAPDVGVPITAYLDPRRVFTTAWARELYALDPLCRPAYPVRFLADLVTADTTALYDGRLGVPVTVVTARRDPLFALADTRATLERIRAPAKNLVVLDATCHLVLNEALDLALPAVLTALDRLTASTEETSHA